MSDLRTKLLAKRTVTAVPLGTGEDGSDLEAFVRVMTTNELLEVQRTVKADELQDIDAAAWMACKTICDADGTRLFGDTDIALVKTMDVSVLIALANAAAEANSLGKKKASATTNDSSTGSPPT